MWVAQAGLPDVAQWVLSQMAVILTKLIVWMPQMGTPNRTGRRWDGHWALSRETWWLMADQKC
jgi:hypothetical protein